MFAAAVLDLLGASLVLPILAPLLLREEGGMFAAGTPEATRASVLGLLLAAFPLAHFAGGPLVGVLSDRYGRRRVLATTMTVATLGYVLGGLAVLRGSVALLLLARLVGGLLGANAAQLQAVVADVSAPGERARRFGLLSAAGGVGFIVGPLLGGWLAQPPEGAVPDFVTPFWLAAALMACNLALVAWGVPRRPPAHEGARRTEGEPRPGLLAALGVPRVRAVLGLVGVMTLGWPIYVQFLPIYLLHRFDAGPARTGQLFAYVGVWMVVTQTVVLGWASRRWATRPLFQASLLGLAVTWLLLLWPPRLEWLLLLLPLQVVCEGLAWPSVTALASRAADADGQGRVLGALSSVRALAMAVAPVLAGATLRFHPALPVLLASAALLLAFLGSLHVLRPESPSQPRSAT
jgi:DHA1 family tetracycline resistance protein-like MFS transporter